MLVWGPRHCGGFVVRSWLETFCEVGRAGGILTLCLRWCCDLACMSRFGLRAHKSDLQYTHIHNYKLSFCFSKQLNTCTRGGRRLDPRSPSIPPCRSTPGRNVHLLTGTVPPMMRRQHTRVTWRALKVQAKLKTWDVQPLILKLIVFNK